MWLVQQSVKFIIFVGFYKLINQAMTFQRFHSLFSNIALNVMMTVTLFSFEPFKFSTCLVCGLTRLSYTFQSSLVYSLIENSQEFKLLGFLLLNVGEIRHGTLLAPIIHHHHSLTQMVILAVTGQHGLKTLNKFDLGLTRIRYLLIAVACRGKMQVRKLFQTIGGISERQTSQESLYPNFNQIITIEVERNLSKGLKI